MAKMSMRVILKSGAEFTVKCDKFTLKRNGLEQVTGYNISGITENKPVYLDFDEVAAIVRVFSDEADAPPEDGGNEEQTESEGSDMGKKKTGLITDEVRELINEVARETASMAYIDGMGGEVNYFRAMESLLFNYKKLAALVADYEAYTHVELQGRSASISSYSPSSGYTYRTEEDILDEMKRDKIISYHRTRARFEEIDRVVKLFAERKEFHVIRMYYFGEDAQGNERPAGAEPYTWEAIAAELEEMGLIRDAKSARRWRNKIVNDMAVCMFGKPAAVGVGTYRKERDRG